MLPLQGAESPVSGGRDMFKLMLTRLRDTAEDSLTPGGKLNQMDLEFTGYFHFFKKPYRNYMDYTHHTTSNKNHHRFKTSTSRSHSLLNQSLWEGVELGHQYLERFFQVILRSPHCVR